MWFKVVRMELAVVGCSRGGGRGPSWVWVGKGSWGDERVVEICVGGES